MAQPTTTTPDWETEWHFAEWVAERHRHDKPAHVPEHLPALSTEELIVSLHQGHR